MDDVPIVRRNKERGGFIMAAKKKARKKTAGKKTGTRKAGGRAPKAAPAAAAGKPDGRARYSDEFKKAAVARILGGETAKAVSGDLGVSAISLGQWKKKLGAARVKAPAAAGGAAKRRGRPRKARAPAAPKAAVGVAGKMEAKLRQIEQLKQEIKSLAGQL
jgi:transposase-like protein